MQYLKLIAAAGDPDGIMEFLKIVGGGITGAGVLLGVVVLFLKRTLLTRGELDNVVVLLKAQIDEKENERMRERERGDEWKSLALMKVNALSDAVAVVANKAGSGKDSS